MEGEESDWDDLPDWVRDFLDKNELTDFVRSYLKKRVPYETFKDWTFEELRAIKFRSNVLNRSELSQTSPLEPLPFLCSPDEQEKVDTENRARNREPTDGPSHPIRGEHDREWLEGLIYSSIHCPNLVPTFRADWTIEELYNYACRFFPDRLLKPPNTEKKRSPSSKKSGHVDTVEPSDTAWDMYIAAIEEDREERSESEPKKAP